MPDTMSRRYQCDATFVLGQFLFECIGHHFEGDELHAQAFYPGGRGVLVHHSSSPGEPGDCELTWYTAAQRPDEDITDA